jgi:hypothetical protein
MDLFTFDESYNPDLSSKKLRAEILKAIRRQIEQHMSANLPGGEVARSSRRWNSDQLRFCLLPLWRRHGSSEPLPRTAP